MPTPIYASRLQTHSTPQPFTSASTGFPAQQAEGSKVHVEVEDVEEDVKQEVEGDMQQHITNVLCKGRADGGIWGGAGGEAQEKACKVKQKRPDTSNDDGCQGSSKGAGASVRKVEEAEMRSKELRRNGEARNLSREERKMLAIVRQIEEMERKEKAVKAVSEAGAWRTQLGGRAGHGNEKVGSNAAGRASASTTAKEASASNAADQASASTTATEAGARIAAGRASASTTAKKAFASNAVGRAPASTTA